MTQRLLAPYRRRAFPRPERSVWFAVLILILSVISAIAAAPTALAAARVVAPGQPWTTWAAMPTARYGLAVVASPDGDIYAIGGWANGTGLSSTVEVYSTVTATWRTAAPMPAPRGLLAAAMGGDGKIYAIGGTSCATEGCALGTLDIYDPATNTWTAGPSMPSPREELAAATGPDGRIYVIGGENGSGSQLATVEAFDPRTGTWSTNLTPMPTARDNLGVATGLDGRIYAIGGQNCPGGGCSLSTVEAYDPSANQWTTGLAPMPTARDQLAIASGADGDIYALGGENPSGTVLNTDEIYSPTTNQWTTSPAPMPTARLWLGAATGTDNNVYAIGGADANSKPSGATQSTPSGGLRPAPTESIPYTGVIAYFHDTDRNGNSGSYSATIDWGDGTTTPASRIIFATPFYYVFGTHTYTDEQTAYPVIHVTDSDGTTQTVGISSIVRVADATLQARGFLLRGPFSSYNGVIAYFTDSNPAATVGDYHAIIDWGDGTTSTATIAYNSSLHRYEASGSHNYSASDYYSIRTTIQDIGGATATALTYAPIPRCNPKFCF